MSLKDFGKIFSPFFIYALILKLLSKKPMHGYNIASELSRITGFNVTKPLIYITLRKLEALGFIISKWDVSEGKARRIYYITESGEQFLEMNKELLTKLKELLDFVIGDDE